MENENRNAWTYGFTPGAENWNGRLAMIGFVAAIAVELVSGQGVLHFWGVIQYQTRNLLRLSSIKVRAYFLILQVQSDSEDTIHFDAGRAIATLDRLTLAFQNPAPQ